MKLARWQPRPGPNPDAGTGDVVRGRGLSYLRYNNAITYVAAVAEVEVDKSTGTIRVTRVCLSHDCGEMVNPDGVANQVEGGVLQTVSRTLKESVRWNRDRVTSVDWLTYPIMAMPAHRPSGNPRLGRRRADGLRHSGRHRQRGVRRHRRAPALGAVHARKGQGGADPRMSRIASAMRTKLRRSSIRGGGSLAAAAGCGTKARTL